MSSSSNSVPVKRSMEAIKNDNSYDETLPISYPTNFSHKFDICLKILQSGVPVARIAAHKQHLCNNIPYFAAMLNPESCFRENDATEIKMECPYPPELVLQYMKSLYTGKLELNDKNCLGFVWMADFLNDTNGMVACEQYLTKNMTEDIMFEIMAPNDCFNRACIEYIKKSGIKDLDAFAERVWLLPFRQFTGLMDGLKGALPSRYIIKLKVGWLKENPDDSQFQTVILGINFAEQEGSLRFKFYGELQEAKIDISEATFNHIFVKQNEVNDTDPESARIHPKIRQIAEIVDRNQKTKRFYEFMENTIKDLPTKTLVFAKSMHQCEHLAANLARKGWKAAVLPGIRRDLLASRSGPTNRVKVLADFSTGEITTLFVVHGTLGGLRFQHDQGHFGRCVVIYDFLNIESYISQAKYAIKRDSEGLIPGTAYIMLTSDDAKYVEKLIAILKETGQAVPEELHTLKRSYQRQSIFR